MKTQKQLPKEFTFVSDENSREQLEKLGVRRNGYNIDNIGFYYLIESNKVVDTSRYQFPNVELIDLSDYIDQEEPKPTKWRFKTRQEFDDTCEKDSDGDYKCGKTRFVKGMFYLFGEKYYGSPDSLIDVDSWTITPEMLMPLEEEPTQSKQKWQSKTRYGYDILALQETIDGYWVAKTQYSVYLCLPSGINTGGNSNFDLIPIDPHFERKAELQAQINKLQEELNSLEK